MNKLKQLLLRKELRIGLITLSAIFMLIYGINYLKGINMLQPTHYFYVRFDNILGLTKSSTVFADGYRIGLVHDIHYDYDHPGNVLVEVQLDREMRIPHGSYAELETAMLGGVTMNVMLPHDATEFYTQGDTIKGYAKGGMTAALEKDIMPQVVMLLPKIDSILTQINSLLANENLTATMKQMRITSENLAATTKNLRGFTERELPELTSSLTNVVTGMTSLTTKFNALDVETTISNTNKTLSTVNNVVQQLDNKINSNDNSLGLFLSDKSLYQHLDSTAVNTSNLLRDLKANPKRYVRFSIW